MKRLYEAGAYGPQGDCWWAEGAAPLDWPALAADTRCDVAVIGGGFTGLSTALHLAQGGADVLVLEAGHPGYGASGRNGGFCCLGGAKAPDALLKRRFGEAGLAEWQATEKAAISTAEGLIDAHGMEVQRHSRGETQLAHNPKAWRAMQGGVAEVERAYGVTPELTAPDALRQEGLGGPWHGAMTLPLGFALNPRAYHGGLGRAAADAGARLAAESPVTGLVRDGTRWRLTTPRGTVTADQVVIATNGYSSEDLPDWLRARTLPVLSSVIVTRPLTEAEQAAQGWTSGQMSFDTRQLLHYFRLMPDGRFLFGMRGGLRSTPSADRAIAKRIRRDFHALFPAWKDVEITHSWSGLVCLLAGLTPFAGAVPGHPGLFAAMGYHGNGVAMATHAGRLLADHMTRGGEIPAAMRTPPTRFPLGRHRRVLLRPAYLAAELFDL